MTILSLNETELRQLGQLAQVDTHDGDLVSRTARDNLVGIGFVQRTERGYNSLTAAGMKFWEESQNR